MGPVDQRLMALLEASAPVSLSKARLHSKAAIPEVMAVRATPNMAPRNPVQLQSIANMEATPAEAKLAILEVTDPNTAITEVEPPVTIRKTVIRATEAMRLKPVHTVRTKKAPANRRLTTQAILTRTLAITEPRNTKRLINESSPSQHEITKFISSIIFRP